MLFKWTKHSITKWYKSCTVLQASRKSNIRLWTDLSAHHIVFLREGGEQFPIPTEQKLLNKIEQVLSTNQVLWRTLNLYKLQMHNLTMRKNFMLQEIVQTLYPSPQKIMVCLLFPHWWDWQFVHLRLWCWNAHFCSVLENLIFPYMSTIHSVYTKEDWSEYLEKDCIKLFSAQAKLLVNEEGNKESNLILSGHDATQQQIPGHYHLCRRLVDHQ